MSDGAATLPPDALRQIDALLRQGELRAAHARLGELVAAHPQQAEPLRLYAGVTQALGDTDGALALLRRALTLDPHWAPTLLMLGELLMLRGDSAAAEPLLRRAAQRLPRAALVLARHQQAQQRPAAALALLAPFVEAGQADGELLAAHVAALAALGRAAEAVAQQRARLAAAPDDALAQCALALALQANGQAAAAEHAANRARALRPRDAAPCFALARSLIARRAYAQAEQALRDGLALDPRAAEAHEHLARLVWMRSGDLAASTALLDAALARCPAEHALHATRAAVLQGAGDARGAFACLQPLTRSPQAPPALLVRAGLAALEVDAAAALALAERALVLVPTDSAAQQLRAAALLGSGDAHAALRTLAPLRAAAPDDQYLIALTTTAWRMLGDERYAQWCDFAQLVLLQKLQTPDGWRDLPSFLADLRASLEKLHDPHGHPLLFQSLRHGTETTDDLSRSADPVIRALFAAFDAPIRSYLDRLGHGDDPLRARNDGTRRYRFNGAWSVRLRANGFHQNHVHPRGWISSACYVQLPETLSDGSDDAGCLSFGAPGIPTAMALPAQHRLRPEPGLLALFPSYVWHGTVPFTGNRARLTVAFDVLPAQRSPT